MLKFTFAIKQHPVMYYKLEKKCYLDFSSANTAVAVGVMVELKELS